MIPLLELPPWVYGSHRIFYFDNLKKKIKLKIISEEQKKNQP